MMPESLANTCQRNTANDASTEVTAVTLDLRFGSQSATKSADFGIRCNVWFGVAAHDQLPVTVIVATVTLPETSAIA